MEASDFAVALAAASFAFMFFLVGEALVTGYELFRRYRDALQRIQALLNGALQAIVISKNNIQAMTTIVAGGRRIVNMPRRFRLGDDEPFTHVVDEQMVNDYMDFREKALTVNEYIDNFAAYYESVYGRFVAGDLNKQQYVSEAMHVVGGFRSLDGDLDDFRGQILDLLAKLRLRIQEPQSVAALLIEWILFKVYMSPAPPMLTRDRIKEVRAQLEAEMNEVPNR